MIAPEDLCLTCKKLKTIDHKTDVRNCEIFGKFDEKVKVCGAYMEIIPPPINLALSSICDRCKFFNLSTKECDRGEHTIHNGFCLDFVKRVVPIIHEVEFSAKCPHCSKPFRMRYREERE